MIEAVSHTIGESSLHRLLWHREDHRWKAIHCYYGQESDSLLLWARWISPGPYTMEGIFLEEYQHISLTASNPEVFASLPKDW
jgi:hypothetical protein